MWTELAKQFTCTCWRCCDFADSDHFGQNVYLVAVADDQEDSALGHLSWKEYTSMKKSTVAISALAITLIASNLWWAYQVVDAGVTYTYQGAELEENRQALSQTLAIIGVIGSGDASRDQIVTAANNAWSFGEPFEKAGYLWVGRLGLRFSETDKLVGITL